MSAFVSLAFCPLSFLTYARMLLHTHPPRNFPPECATVSWGGGDGHQVTPPPNSGFTWRQFSFGAFGAWYFIYFLGQVTVSRGGGGLQRGGGCISGGGMELGRRGPKPIVDDSKIAAWSEAQRTASLAPDTYVPQQLWRGTSRQAANPGSCLPVAGPKWWGRQSGQQRVHGRPTRMTSGTQWFRLWKKRHPEYTSHAPRLVESARANARLTRAEWRRFFF